MIKLNTELFRFLTKINKTVKIQTKGTCNKSLNDRFKSIIIVTLFQDLNLSGNFDIHVLNKMLMLPLPCRITHLLDFTP